MLQASSYAFFTAHIHAGTSDCEVCINLPTVSSRHAVLEIGAHRWPLAVLAGRRHDCLTHSLLHTTQAALVCMWFLHAQMEKTR
jgi:hypothetical protein